MSSIVINATAARSTGALSILRDFIDYLSCDTYIAENEFHLFTCIDTFDTVVMKNRSTLTVHKVKVQSWFSRIMWDESGFRRYCRKSHINPDLIISMQNTCANFPSVKQLVYFHQPLPLIRYRWNIFDKNELILFMYSKFYGSFVNRHNANANYVVQLPFIRDLFLRKFRNVAEDRVVTIRPNTKQITTDTIDWKSLADSRFIFFYPSTDISYKNHQVLIEALCLLRKEAPSVLSHIKVFFTVSHLNKRLMKLLDEYDLRDTVTLLGLVPFSEILVYYNSVDALVFPSKIETFGLPLVEAASFGLPIVAADLLYAREVLVDYPNTVFMDPSSPRQWGEMFRNCSSLKKTKVRLNPTTMNSWNLFLAHADTLIHRR